jgi:hypothetical protein
MFIFMDLTLINCISPVVERNPLLSLYTAAIFVSAALLFIVQPLFARMVLPLLGGSPAVWNTALVFYQAVLLAGYAYAHFITRRLSYRHQIILHLFLLCLPLLLLPIHLPSGWLPPTESSPVLWLLALLGVAVGLPFFVISAGSPLLQRWFAGTGHPAGDDPYFLYGASNLGSLLALLGYPLIIEPWLPLVAQSQWWAVGYGVLLVLMVGCAVMLWRSSSAGIGLTSGTTAKPEDETLTLRRRVKWLLLAFVPSSLMLSVTTYISTDIAAIPLLWVIPLALYLLTFILVFARRPVLPQRWLIRAAPLVMLALVLLLIVKLHASVTILLISSHLAALLVVALVCHGELARDRPSAGHLTEFYLWMSLGGVLGGIFNALIAPLIFKEVVEYPLTLVLAGLLLPVVTTSVQSKRQQKAQRKSRLENENWPWLERWNNFEQRYGRVLDFGLPLALGLLAAGLILALQNPDPNLVSDPLAVSFMFGLPALICFSFSRRPVRFGLGMGAMLLASTLYFGGKGHPLYVTRSFFGITHVVSFSAQHYHLLVHGNTIHGIQSPEPARRTEPLSYYTRTGPLGELFAALSGARAPHTVAVVGLGAGTTACYRQPGQEWTFYEIDPNIERLARDTRYFTFLQDCAPEAQVVLGDARLSLAAAPAAHYDLILLDAYSSDAIPVHLLTRQALRLYLDKLTPHGVLAFHLTNGHLNLDPVVFNLALDAGVTYRLRKDLNATLSDFEMGKMGSVWAVIARTPADLGPLADNPNWLLPATRPKLAVWTDDFSSLLSVYVWQ